MPLPFPDPYSSTYDYAYINTSIDDGSFGYNSNGINTIIDAANERILVTGIRYPLIRHVVNDDMQTGWPTSYNFISLIQSTLQAICTQFFNYKISLNTLSYSDIYNIYGYPLLQNYTVPLWFQNASIDSGIPDLVNGFRRKTNISSWDTPGYFIYGDIIGPWIWEDLMACISALKGTVDIHGLNENGNHGQCLGLSTTPSWSDVITQANGNWPDGYGMPGFELQTFIDYTDHTTNYQALTNAWQASFTINVPPIAGNAIFYIIPTRTSNTHFHFLDIYSLGFVEGKLTQFGSSTFSSGTGTINISDQSALINPLNIIPPPSIYVSTSSQEYYGFYLSAGFSVLNYSFTRSNF